MGIGKIFIITHKCLNAKNNPTIVCKMTPAYNNTKEFYVNSVDINMGTKLTLTIDALTAKTL